MGLLAFTKKFVLKDQSGVSIVEGLIGLGAIAGLAAVIATISTNTNNRGLIYRRACESMAVNAIDAITDEAIFMDVVHFTPSASKQEITNANGIGLYQIAEINNADLWPATITIVDNPLVNTDVPAFVRNEVQIQGAMRALNALYNNSSSTDLCGTPAAPVYWQYPDASITALGIENELTRTDPLNPPTVEYNLQAISLSDNTASCPAKPYFIVPAAGSPANQVAYLGTSYDSTAGAGTGVDGIIQRETSNVTTSKWRLSARVNYTHEGNAFNCIVTRDFEYPQDAQPPTTSNISVQISENLTRDTDFAAYEICTGATATAIRPNNHSIGIQITVTDVEEGSLLFCRDISEEMVYDDSTVAAETGAPLGNFCWAGDNNSGNIHGRVNPMESHTNASAINDTAAADDKWYPCHAARICGGVGGASDNYGALASAPIAPDDALVLGTNAELTQRSNFPLTISLHYSNVPTDCIVGLQVVAVDVAGNVSAAISSKTIVPASGANVQNLFDPAEATADPLFSTLNITLSAPLSSTSREVHRPWCGNRGAVAPGAIGSSGSNSWGTEDEYGVLCLPAPPGSYTVSATGDTLTPNWWSDSYGGESTDNVTYPMAGDPTVKGNIKDNFDWRDEFPNGYYTCRPGGCCFSTLHNVCTPWSN